MQQIYKRTTMPKWEFAAYFQNTFYLEHFWTAASEWSLKISSQKLFVKSGLVQVFK